MISKSCLFIFKNLIIFISLFEKCAQHTWYLAVDMQLHWFSIIPIILILFNRKLGIWVTGCFIAGFMLMNSIEVYMKNLSPDLVITSKT